MDSWVQGLFWGTLCILLICILYEYTPTRFKEGFSDVIGVGDSPFWAKLVPRRGDVGPELEEEGLIRDKRYFSGYADVQRFGVDTDFCRMVQQGNDERNKFFACALGGTENLSSIEFRSPSVREGLILGRDDYMRDVSGDGRSDYCRVVKKGVADFAIECNPATETGFRGEMVPDNNPPDDMRHVLDFYEGCVFWLRFRDDMVDYAGNLYINATGGAKVQEQPPRPDITDGLVLNGINQFIRMGDDSYLNLGSVIQLRSLRAIHFWVRFDEFTNNAHIFDFGNGAGIDNVWVGILNRGNQGADAEAGKRPLLCGGDATSTLPEFPSGAQPDEEVTPQTLMKTTAANCDEYDCPGFAVAPRKVSHPFPRQTKKTGGPAKTADMCYEIWDKDQRKMRIVVPNMFTKGEWCHVVITAEGTDAFRPDIVVYKNGKRTFVEPNGWLPQNSLTEKNYIGKSNWANVTSQYANKDELFKGALFDFRGYIQPLGKDTILNSYQWGSGLLGL